MIQLTWLNCHPASQTLTQRIIPDAVFFRPGHLHIPKRYVRDKHMKFESNNIKDYLVSTEIIDWHTPSVLEKAKKITKDKTTDIDKGC